MAKFAVYLALVVVLLAVSVECGRGGRRGARKEWKRLNKLRWQSVPAEYKRLVKRFRVDLACFEDSNSSDPSNAVVTTEPVPEDEDDVDETESGDNLEESESDELALDESVRLRRDVDEDDESGMSRRERRRQRRLERRNNRRGEKGERDQQRLEAKRARQAARAERRQQKLAEKQARKDARRAEWERRRAEKNKSRESRRREKLNRMVAFMEKMRGFCQELETRGCTMSEDLQAQCSRIEPTPEPTEEIEEELKE